MGSRSLTDGFGKQKTSPPPLLLLLQTLQIQRLKVLDFSSTSFHLTRSRMHFVHLFISTILKSSLYRFPTYFWSSYRSCRYRFTLVQFFDSPITCHSVYMVKSALSLDLNALNYFPICN